MKQSLLYLVLLIISYSCADSIPKELSNKLLSAYNERNFFKLEELMSKIKTDKGNPDLLLYHATIDNAFNKPQESNQLINTLLRKYPGYFNDTLVKDLYSMRSANAYRLQDYLSAYYDDSIIVNKFSHVCDSSEIATRNEDISVFRSLKDVPKMEIQMAENSKIPVSRDIAGMQNVLVTLQTDSLNLIFDSGAEFSVIMESIAKRNGVKMINDKVWTSTGTGKKVEGHMGLLNIKLGDIALKNVAFLVLPDSLLTFADGMYVVKGIIGFPVMYSFIEFTIIENEFITVSQKQQKSGYHNIALDGQYMLINLTANKDTLPFLFDSGSQTTTLSSLFFNTHKNNILEKCKKVKVESASAGGTDTSEAYFLDSLHISTGNSYCKIDSLVIYPMDLSGSDMKYLYGTLGQDYVSKFSEMRISFSSMNISFTNKK